MSELDEVVSRLCQTYHLDLLLDLLEVYKNRRSGRMSYEEIRRAIDAVKQVIDGLDRSVFDAESILQRSGIELERLSDPNMAKLYHSLYLENDSGRKIVIYDEWIKPVYLAELQMFISREQVLQLHLAHECYHLLESEQPELTAKLAPKALAPQWSEIAAHDYARKFTAISVHPRLIGSILAIQNEWLDVQDFESSIHKQVQFVIKKGANPNDILI